MKLSTLVHPLALAALLASSGCKKEPTAAPAPGGSAATAARAEGTAPTVSTADDATARLPRECAEYKAGIERLTRCETLPAETRDVLKQAYDQAAASWAKEAGQRAGEEAITAMCKNAVDAIADLGTFCP